MQKSLTKASEQAVGGFRTLAEPSPQRTPVHPILKLQQTIGNKAVLELLRYAHIQPKLTINQPGDVYEQEADKIADQVVSSSRSTGAQPKCSCGGTAGSDGECDECLKKRLSLQRKTLGPEPAIRASGLATQSDPSVPPAVQEPLRSSGQPLDSTTRVLMETQFGQGFSHVRVHTDEKAAVAARTINALAYTSGRDVVFGANKYAPQTTEGRRLLAHELTHVVQQRSAPRFVGSLSVSQDSSLEQESNSVPAFPPSPVNSQNLRKTPEPWIMRDAPPNAIARTSDSTIEVVIHDRGVAEFTRSSGGPTHRLGESAGPNILIRLFPRVNGSANARWFNFARGEVGLGTLEDWEFRQGVAGAFSASENERFAAIGRQFTPAQWRAMDKDPTTELLAKYEAGSVSIADEAVLTTYKGLIHSEAERTLKQNEAQIDALLAAPDRVEKLKTYTQGLLEASQVRDTLEQATEQTKAELSPRREELNRRLAQSQAFNFGIAGTVINLDTYQRLGILRQIGEIDQKIASKEEAVAFWKSVFPLLTRLKTADINPEKVQQSLQTIKDNIVSARLDLERAVVGRGSFDLLDLQPIRAKVDERIGAKAGKVVAAEDKSRGISKIVGTVALTAASIALLFVPGGVFIDAAIGVALAAKSIDDAISAGHAANTGLNVDDGLMTQAQASDARIQAILSTIFAAVGALASGFKVLRLARIFSRLGTVAPELNAASKFNLARLIASNPNLIKEIRTTAELQEFLKALGKSISPAEFQALRSLANLEVRGLSVKAGLERANQIRMEAAAAGGPGPIARGRTVGFARGVIDGKPVEEVKAVSGQFKRAGFVDLPENPQFTTIATGRNTRELDAERKILESIAQGLKASSKGRLILFSEIENCISCSNVIAQFRKAFPNIELIVQYGPP